ncbi:MAG: DUF2752 domain-containing protein [Clostridia bacterium]|nr:DUF2752 domain-containing protein [Clostridia bacterium]
MICRFLKSAASYCALRPLPAGAKRSRMLFAALCIGLYAGVMFALDLPCPILALLHIPCFGCGMTRALIAAAQLRFGEAFSCHRMFWSVPLLIVLLLYEGAPFRRRWLNAALLACLLLGFFLNWLLNSGVMH